MTGTVVTVGLVLLLRGRDRWWCYWHHYWLTWLYCSFTVA